MELTKLQKTYVINLVDSMKTLSLYSCKNSSYFDTAVADDDDFTCVSTQSKIKIDQFIYSHMVVDNKLPRRGGHSKILGCVINFFYHLYHYYPFYLVFNWITDFDKSVVKAIITINHLYEIWKEYDMILDTWNHIKKYYMTLVLMDIRNQWYIEYITSGLSTKDFMEACDLYTEHFFSVHENIKQIKGITIPRVIVDECVYTTTRFKEMTARIKI
jgi:hypothetical protein